MGFRPQVKSSRSGRGHQKTHHDKTKVRKQRYPSSNRYAGEETNVPTREETVEKTLKMLRSLGNQKFALSPFSQYFDDWLINLREALSVFESNSMVNTDGKFIDERTRILAGIESELIRERLDEAAVRDKLKDRSEKNHLLASIDTEYAAETREVKRKRSAEIENLTKNVSDLEKKLDEISKTKTSFFGSFSKKNKARKQAEVVGKLGSAKKELEMAIQNFAIEQEKIHDEYEKKKQETIIKIQALNTEIEKQETDNSLQYRQATCESLVEALTSFLERKQAN